MSSSKMQDWTMFVVYKDRKLIASHGMALNKGPVKRSTRLRRDVPWMDKEYVVVS